MMQLYLNFMNCGRFILVRLDRAPPLLALCINLQFRHSIHLSIVICQWSYKIVLYLYTDRRHYTIYFFY